LRGLAKEGIRGREGEKIVVKKTRNLLATGLLVQEISNNFEGGLVRGSKGEVREDGLKDFQIG
jgi:hypothetical protein